MADAASTPAVRAQGVAVTLGGRTVLEDVDLELRKGETLALIGPNGAGKTTLLRALAGLTTFAGQIGIMGLDVRSADRKALARNVALVPQRSQLEALLPVRTVVAQGRYAHAVGFGQLRADDHAAIERAMQRADVTQLADRVLPELSHGEQRRVLLARALCTEASVLLLDEPTAALDLPHALGLLDSLRELGAAGHAIVLVVHHLDEALRGADRCALLDRGRLLADGPSAEILHGPEVARVYGVEIVAGGGLGFRLRERGSP